MEALSPQAPVRPMTRRGRAGPVPVLEAGLLQLWGVVGPYHLAVAHFQAGEPVGGAGVVVETHDGAVGVGYVQARPSPGLVDAAMRDVQPVAPGGDVLQDMPPGPARRC
jgi:hypothetical protein